MSIPSNFQPTVVFETYWEFAAERQRIFEKRLAGDPQPWTTDPILSAHKFTNAFRACDRVSQFLIREVFFRSRPHRQMQKRLFFESCSSSFSTAFRLGES
jgi:hypothetical protein